MNIRRLDNSGLLFRIGNSLYSHYKPFGKQLLKSEVWLMAIATITLALFSNIYTIFFIILSFILLVFERDNSKTPSHLDQTSTQFFSNIKVSKNLRTSVSATLIILFLIFALLFLIESYNPNAPLAKYPDKVNKVLKLNYKEYLLFIGTIFLASFLQTRKFKTFAKIIFTIGLLWLFYFRSINSFLSNLGFDALEESHNFVWKEAFFWLETFAQVVTIHFDAKAMFLYLIITLSFYMTIKKSFFLLHIPNNYYSYLKLITSITLITFCFYHSLKTSANLVLNTRKSYFNIVNNFNSVTVPNIAFEKTPLTVAIYIGESTTSLNMSLYGYPRDTTPKLRALKENDNNMIVFDNVFSTHVFTNPSLLEALSIGIDPSDNYLPIETRKRLSIVDILKKSGIPTTLYSNQGHPGIINYPTSIIFKNVIYRSVVDTHDGWFNDNRLERIWDHEHLNSFLQNKGFQSNEKELLVFHSYAGHGGYLKNIPEFFRGSIDRYILSKSNHSIVGNNKKLSKKQIDYYDSAIGYIDSNVSKAIETIKHVSKPTIFIYFSDHGDAAYANLGHDSSRFAHEMARIPFLIYFNDAAKSRYPGLFQSYLESSKQGLISTLAQLPATIFDLLGCSIEDSNKLIAHQTKPIGQKTTIDPIVIREMDNKISFISLDGKKMEITEVNGKRFEETSDDATKMFVTTKENSNFPTLFCYHQTNSIGKALRAAITSDCLEVDIMFRDSESIAVYHPPSLDTGLNIDDIFTIAKQQKKAIWLNGKNIDLNNNCEILINKLKTLDHNPNSVLIEFPTYSHIEKEKINKCTNELKLKGYHLSYYVPSKLSSACSKAIKSGHAYQTAQACLDLNQDLESAASSTLYTDISVDFQAITALEKAPAAKHFDKWNLWNINHSNFSDIAHNLEKFRMIALNNKDPNDN